MRRLFSFFRTHGLMTAVLIGILLSFCSFNQVYQQSLSTPFLQRLADSAYTLTQYPVTYDPSYYRIPYPMGDVPADKGVCTDVVIRAYRKMGIDLQKEVHEDMKANFNRYPKAWGMTTTDRNIDHRRVPNLMTFFGRKGTTLTITKKDHDYQPGHIVCWNLGGGVTHIGLVSSKKIPHSQRYMIIHNIGAGQVAEDVLFSFTIIGHYHFIK